MKILITTEWYDPAVNGVVVSVDNLKKGLEELGHEVRVLTVSSSWRSLNKEQVTYIGSVNAGRIYPGARVAIPAPRISRHIHALIRWGPDIIHSQSEFSTFYMARSIAAYGHVPIVHTYHTVYEDYTHYFIPSKRLGRTVVSRLSRQILARTACVIVPTEKVRAMLLGYGVTADIEVIPTGLDPGSAPGALSEDDKLAFRQRWGIPDQSKVLVAVGRLAKEKSLEEILLFLSKLARQDVTLLIVGDGPNRVSLQEYAGRLGLGKQVVFTGMVKHSEIAAFYQIGDVFVNASRSETQGLSTLEALANGVPLLCRKDPSWDLVIREGANGWQYEALEDFNEKLEGLLQKTGPFRLAPDMADKDLRDHSYKEFARRVEAVYVQCAGRSFEKEIPPWLLQRGVPRHLHR